MVHDPHSTRRSYLRRTEIPSPPLITTPSPGSPGGRWFCSPPWLGRRRALPPTWATAPHGPQRLEGLPCSGNRRTVPPPHRAPAGPPAALTHHRSADRLIRSGSHLDQQAAGHSLGRAGHPIDRAAGSPLPRDVEGRLAADRQLAATQAGSGQGRPGRTCAGLLEKKRRRIA